MDFMTVITFSLVTGVNDYAEMLDATVTAVSAAAAAVGVQVGMSGAAALQRMDNSTA